MLTKSSNVVSRPLIARARRLRIAGICEVKRLQEMAIRDAFKLCDSVAALRSIRGGRA